MCRGHERQYEQHCHVRLRAVPGRCRAPSSCNVSTLESFVRPEFVTYRTVNVVCRVSLDKTGAVGGSQQNFDLTFYQMSLVLQFLKNCFKNTF